MTDEIELHRLTEALRAVGAPPEPPREYEEIAREAALGTSGAPPAEVVRIDRVRVRRRLWRPALAIAVIAASTIAALVIGVGGDQMPVVRTVNMSATSGATASIDFGEADGPVRPVVMKVSNLPPAGAGQYYEAWMSKDGKDMPVASFNTDADGSVTAKTTMPSDMGWDRCWITLESATDESDANATVVLAST
jgi:hypothetical protein